MYYPSFTLSEFILALLWRELEKGDGLLEWDSWILARSLPARSTKDKTAWCAKESSFSCKMSILSL